MTIYVIAENRQAAERLGRLHASGTLSAPCNGRHSEAIARWRKQPERLRHMYHVFAVEAHTNHDVTLVTRTVRLALIGIVIGIILGAVVH